MKCGASVNSRLIVVDHEAHGRDGRLVRHFEEGLILGGVSGWCSRRRRHATSAIVELVEAH